MSNKDHDEALVERVKILLAESVKVNKALLEALDNFLREGKISNRYIQDMLILFEAGIESNIANYSKVYGRLKREYK